jgi:hypothetical protein
MIFRTLILLLSDHFTQIQTPFLQLTRFLAKYLMEQSSQLYHMEEPLILVRMFRVGELKSNQMPNVGELVCHHPVLHSRSPAMKFFLALLVLFRLVPSRLSVFVKTSNAT